MKYAFMIGVAFCLAIFSSLMTAFGMMDLFNAAGTFILILFIVIDLGRFLLFNFVVDDWHNLRKVKYIIVFILVLLFGYSAVGIYSKLDSLVAPETRQAMVNAASYNKAADNAEIKQTRSEGLANIAQSEYKATIEWNTADYTNCISRAQTAADILVAENKCNNTKRRLDKAALSNLQKALATADTTLDTTQETTKVHSENQSEIASVLTSLCKITAGECNTYGGLQDALTLLILLVIAGTDYLQIAIILAVNTRKNKKIETFTKKVTEEIKTIETVTEPIITPTSVEKELVKSKPRGYLFSDRDRF